MDILRLRGPAGEAPRIDPEIRRAALIITAGGLVAFPTETVYGLGADAFNPAALAKVFAVKGRPRFDPLIIHLAGREDLGLAADCGALSPKAQEQADVLCRTLWPGPLTLILPKVPAIPDLATSGLPTVAVRVPAHPIAQALIRFSTRAVAAPSANPFGYLSPTTAEHVREQLGSRVDMIIDGGPAGVGVESTVLDLTTDPPRILRPGGVPQERIEALIGPTAVGDAPAGVSASPGQLPSHYAPQVPLILHDAGEIPIPYSPAAAYLFFDPPSRDRRLERWGIASAQGNPRIRVLSDNGTLTEAAANLFTILHDLDTLPIAAIHAERVPAEGLGNAVNDRLTRAGSRRYCGRPGPASAE